MLRHRSRLGACVILLIATVALQAHAQSQSPLVPLDTRWPERIAAGMRQGDQLPPLTVEARRDGWVIVTFLGTRPDAGQTLPKTRLVLEAADVKRWTSRVRVALSPASDSLANQVTRRVPQLGNGHYYITLRIEHDPKAGANLSVLGCGRGNSGSQPSRPELSSLLTLLDSAAELAGGGAGRPPTLQRAYYASEVSCPVSPKYDFKTPGFPDDIPASQRQLTNIGVQYIVDEKGEIERGSIAVFPGTDPRFEQAVKRAMAEWYFRPAEWDATPVRQLVQHTIVFDPVPQPYRAARQHTDTIANSISLRAEHDGWVRFQYDSPFMPPLPSMYQEFFTPDSVDAWVNHVEALYAEAAAFDRTPPRSVRKYTFLGTRAGVIYNAGYSAQNTTVQLGANVIACAGAGVEGAAAPGAAQLARFRAVALEARALRDMPDDPRRIAHDEVDVACPAWLPWRRSALRDFFRVWQYPTGVYPSTMTATQAHAEVLASFVVDTAGIADPATLQVMPGSDPRAVDALPASLCAFRFRPATRGGMTVSQRVLQTILFEPPPVCAAPTLGPACARRYTDDLSADRPGPWQRYVLRWFGNGVEGGVSPRYELIAGEQLVTPAPRSTHQMATMER